MARDIYQLPVSDQHTSVVELGEGGRRFRKQLVKFGSYVNPLDKKSKMTLDRTWAERVVGNFKSGVLNRVPVAEGHPTNSGDLLTKTRGDLAALSIEDDGLYGELDIKASETVKGIENDLIYDVSVSFDDNYLDKTSGSNVGPALLHVGLVNDPYLKGMTPFQALSDKANVIMLSESKEYEVSNVQVKNTQEYPVEIKFTVDGEEKTVTVEPGAEVEVPETEVEGVNKQVAEAVKPEEAPAEPKEPVVEPAPVKPVEPVKPHVPAEPTAEEKLAVAEKELADMKHAQMLSDASNKFDELVKEGKLVPAQKDAYISLSTAATSQPINLSDGTTKALSDLVADLLSAAPKVHRFSEEGRAEGEEQKTPWDQLTAEQQNASRKAGTSQEEYNQINSKETE